MKNINWNCSHCLLPPSIKHQSSSSPPQLIHLLKPTTNNYHKPLFSIFLTQPLRNSPINLEPNPNTSSNTNNLPSNSNSDPPAVPKPMAHIQLLVNVTPTLNARTAWPRRNCAPMASCSTTNWVPITSPASTPSMSTVRLAPDCSRPRPPTSVLTSLATSRWAIVSTAVNS